MTTSNALTKVSSLVTWTGTHQPCSHWGSNNSCYIPELALFIVDESAMTGLISKDEPQDAARMQNIILCKYVEDPRASKVTRLRGCLANNHVDYILYAS